MDGPRAIPCCPAQRLGEALEQVEGELVGASLIGQEDEGPEPREPRPFLVIVLSTSFFYRPHSS
jgi:hypothetical protein